MSKELKTHSCVTSQDDFSAVTSRKMSAELNSKEMSRKGSRPKEERRVNVNILEKRDNTKNEEIYIKKVMKLLIFVGLNDNHFGKTKILYLPPR